MRNLARWCFTHRRIVILAWLATAIGITAVGSAVGTDYTDGNALTGTESAEAIELLQQNAPQSSGNRVQIVLAAEGGAGLTDPGVRREVESMLTDVGRLPHVGTVESPYEAQGQVSADGSIAFATVTFDQEGDELPDAATERVISLAESSRSDALQIEFGGDGVGGGNPEGTGGLPFGMGAALLVLLLVFGSLLAAALPLITAGAALATGVAVMGMLSQVFTMPDFSSELALLIGLGVGVDYALFIVTRYRQGLMRGLSSEEAVVQSLDTAGRAVLFAGLTVCIALLGMLTLGVTLLSGAGIAASVVVAFTVLTAVTLLPALLGFFGPRILTRRARRALAAGDVTTSDESSAWGRWATVLQRRPVLLAGLATALMLVIAVPFLSMRVGSTDSGSDPADSTTRKAYDLLAAGFGPGFNGPLQLVAVADEPDEREQFDAVVSAVAETEGVAGVTPASEVGDGVASAEVFPEGSPQDASTTDLIHALRDTVIPSAAAGDVRVLVSGQTAVSVDFADVISSKLPLFIGVVVLLSFVLLMAVFRSIAIPLMASAMNLLSVGAAFGVVTAVFQWGWFAELIGVNGTGPIDAFLPVMVFAILFGLSMDYEVFLVSRIYEEWHRRGDNTAAVVHGLAATGRTITAAAAVMVIIFAAFILGGDPTIKLFGVGLAAAVLMDALIVRSVLIPGLMLALGDTNWKLPHFLDLRLPRLNVEGDSDTSPSDRKAAADHERSQPQQDPPRPAVPPRRSVPLLRNEEVDR